MKRLKLVVSDFHIGPGRYFKDGTRNILEDFQYDDQFIAFLNYYSSGEYEDAEVELIINGDFLNLLQINYKGVHTYLMTERIIIEGLRKIFEAHDELFHALRSFAETPGHSIAYIVGNHDQGMLFEGARKYFNQIVGQNVTFYDSHYEFDHIRVEHGHMHDWVNKFNNKRYFLTKGLPEPVLNMPWGSIFVAEILPRIKMERSYVDKVKPFRRLIWWMVLYDTTFALKALFMIAWFTIDTIFFRARYKYIDFPTTIKGLLNEFTVYPKFDSEARRVLQEETDAEALIMGHTHVMRYRRYREGKEYYNIGTWNEETSLSIGTLGTNVRLTYALIEYPESQLSIDPDIAHDQRALRPKIKLKEWKGFWRPVVDAAV